MCGIYCYCSKGSKDTDHAGQAGPVGVDGSDLEPEYSCISVRGPDKTIVKRLSPQVLDVFHRLAIMDQSSAGDQPMQHPRNDKLWLMCNGEIYNHKKLIEDNKFPVQSQSDCEVILWMYEKYGFEKTVQMLDSESVMVLYDAEKNTLNVSRDPFGVRFMYYAISESGDAMGFASLGKGLSKSFSSVQQFPPGHFAIIDLSQPKYDIALTCYFTLKDLNPGPWCFANYCETIYLREIAQAFEEAVEKRVKMSHREIGCLLSGGLDSSLVTALANKYFKKYYPGQTMKTFSIGMAHSTDLVYAKKVADYLGTDHREYVLTEDEFCSAIPEVIYHLETYDTTTVRASTPNWLLCKYIARDTNCRVIFNGDGSDEVFGGYIYFALAPHVQNFQAETIERVMQIHQSDGRRSDHSISSNGIEARTPFLDAHFVRTVVNIPPELKMHTPQRMEKYLLRKAFEDQQLIPTEVLWRRKEAFSDGVSNAERNTQTIIGEYLAKTPEWNLDPQDARFTYHLPPPNVETKCYRAIFERYFPGHARWVPKYWMPKWCGDDVTDPSARALSHYRASGHAVTSTSK